MKSTHMNIEHLCHMASRQVAEEFRGLKLIFITHTANNRAQIIAQTKATLGKNAHAKAVYNALMRHSEKSNTCFAGLIRTEPRGALSLLQKTEKTAIFFVNSDEFKVLENAKTALYDMLWYALDLVQQTNMKAGRSATHIQNVDGALMHAQDKMSEARHNLTADVFTSVFMALQGYPEHIKQLGQKRAQDSLSATPRKTPEQYPFPIALESTHIIFQDFKTAGKERPLYNALKIAREVGETHTNDMIKQWWSFCSRAQNMAWRGISAQNNISTAIYTSENTYIKATAYIVSEILDLEPKIITNLTSYNPYTDQEVNAHLHSKKCEADAKALAKISVSSNQCTIFDELLTRQIESFIAGDPLGFAPLGTLSAKALYKEQTHDPDLTGHSIHNAYLQGRDQMSWQDIEKLIALTLRVKRKGKDLTPEDIPSLMQKIETLQPHANALLNAILGEEEEAHATTHKKKRRAEDILTDDDYLEMPDDITLDTGDKNTDNKDVDKKEDPATS